MIKKLLSLLIVISIIISYFQVFAQEAINNSWEKPNIIPRASWWANGEFNDKTGIYWDQILQSRANYVTPTRSQESIDAAIQKTQEIEDYLYWNFIEQFTSQETLRTKEEWKYKYAWPLKYTNYIDSIIVHHTHSEYDDSITGMNAIHKYHSLNRQWWDIGYNYIIWYDGNIYEGREGWDYVVWAHSKYNNFGTVWIAIMWNYESEWINTLQYNSLENLIQYLVVRYWIDLNSKRYYHRTCSGIKCDTFHIETYLDSTLIWHRDATHTTCPWEKLYEQIQQIRADNLEFSRWLKPILKNTDSKETPEIKTETNTSQIQKILALLQKFTIEEKQNILKLIDMKLDEDIGQETKKKLQTIRLAVKISLNENYKLIKK